MDAKDILTDAFGRLPDLVHAVVRDLTVDQLRWTPAPGANPIGRLVWHLTRVQDDHVKPDDFDRVVDTAWDPPVTLGVRLVSVYDDATQHAGQAAYLRGLL